ncbi:WXG100 family type VII secretion target [Nocardia sp. NPDC051833]|uniref:PPE domain-containing protein n=1 Tax=Nocardia sp. NPDC051833 TaxID=3155674 RepID=UPI00341A541A
MRSISGRVPGTDPDYAAVVEVFDNLSHAEIHQAVRQLDPAALSAAGELFLTTSTALGDEVENAHGEIGAAIADGWRGSAAQRAIDAVRDFEQAGRRIADVLTAVGVRLGQAGDAAESVRAAVTEPDGAQPDPAAALLDSQQATDNAAIVRRAENARLDAVRAMETIYGGAFVPTGSGVPSFPEITTEPGAADPAVASNGVAGVPSAAVPVVSAGAATTDPAVSEATTAGAGGGNGTTTAFVHTGGGSGAQPVTAGTTTTTTTAAGAQGASVAPATVGAANTVPGGPSSAAPVTPAGYLPSADPRVRRRPAGRPDDETSTAATHDGPTPDDDATLAASTDTASASTESRQDAVAASGDATAGMTAGAMGGLLGGAMVASDTTRPPNGQRPPVPQADDEEDDDEFLRFLDEEPTYLEPADEVNALIGKMEPTSPAVLGEWTERG